jgi:hypothetical protein
MIIDAENMFSFKQSLAAAVGNLLSDKSIFLGTAGTVAPGFNARGSAPHDVGLGQEVEIECKINTSTTDAGATSTLQVQVVMADDEALTTNLTVLTQSAAMAKATTVASYRFAIATQIPPGVSRAYLGLRYVIAGEAITGGTITSCLAFPGGKQTA